MRKLFVCTLLFGSLSCTLFAETVSPLDFGLGKAKNGLERYEVLLKCHQQAVLKGNGVSYKGIDSIYIEIPKNATGIPLPDYTDFANAAITVKNNVKDVYLFTMIHPLQKIQLGATLVDKGDFSSVDSLKRGDYLVVISDANPWVAERLGYGYPSYRRDILLVHNGKAVNTVIMPYDNEWSRMECSYRPVKRKKKSFQNLVFKRDELSTYKTCLLRAVAEDNLLVKHVKVITPPNEVLYGDHIFLVEDCTNFTLEDVEVNGIYSQKKKYGYAFGLNNVWRHKAIRVQADGNWGVYGNNNVSDALLKDCRINRFDIHSYGRDVKCKKCEFFKLYNAYGGTYGTVEYDRCVFNETIPFLDGGSYNTFAPLDIVFKNCIINLRKNEPWLIELMEIPEEVNQRPELKERFLPNVTLRNSTIHLLGGEQKWYIYRTPKSTAGTHFKGGEVSIKKINIDEWSPKMEMNLVKRR